MKIPEYPSTSVVSSNDVILLDGPNGTRKISPNSFFWSMADEVIITTPLRRSIYRGNHIGSEFTDAQKDAIKNGSFKGMFLGDYWSISGEIWRIADFNYWINTGDKILESPHIVIVPDRILYRAKMNDTATTEGGYANSKMRTSGLDQAKEMIFNAFGEENVLNHREYLTNGVSDGHPSSSAWYDSTVELPNEVMMFGCYMCAPAGNGVFVSDRYSIDKSQLGLTNMHPNFINPYRQGCWLRDVVASNLFSTINMTGTSSVNVATNEIGVRPVFGLTGGAA